MNIDKQQMEKAIIATINRFQDITGWQPGESRNALVCDIRDAVAKVFAQERTPAAPESSVTTITYSEPKKECSHFWIMRDEGKVCDWCGKPAQPQAGDVLERMIDAFDEHHGEDRNDMRRRMKLALAVAREGYVRLEDVEKEAAAHFEREHKQWEQALIVALGHWETSAIDALLASLRADVASRRPKQPKALEERVTIHGRSGNSWWEVWLDGVNQRDFDGHEKMHAERYRLGLIAEMREKETR